MKQLIFHSFPEHKPNITLRRISKYMRDIDYEPNNKEIRLAKDLAIQKAPMQLDFHDVVRSILRTNISNERINRVIPFKKIIKKRVITNNNGRPTIIKILRKRNSK